MKLYVFDHCPFCVRAMTAAGLKQNYEIPLSYILEDDAKTPIKMIGKQMVPILEYESGKFMPESLDIVHYLDQLDNTPFLTGKQNPFIEQWVNKHFDTVGAFMMPLYAQMNLPEIATDSARKAYIERHEKSHGSFATLLAESDQIAHEIEAALTQLEQEIDIKHLESQQYSLDDILLFPILRALTGAKKVTLPIKVAQYTKLLAEQSGITLLTEQAQ